MVAKGAIILALGTLASSASAQQPGTFNIVGKTLVSAMMMFLGNEENVYILDKAEGNAVQIKGHPAWGSVWNIKTNKATAVDVVSNSFCASGYFLPDGSWIALGGNGPIAPGPVDVQGEGNIDPTYQDHDGRKAIRLIKPCKGDASTFSDECQWFDDAATLHMQSRRWYSTAEALGTGEILIFGGMQNGGYINRLSPNSKDPQTQNNLASNTFEFYPTRLNFEPPYSQFLINAGGLNTYAHAFLMASGKVLLQANVSTMLFNTDTFEEQSLPNMPKDIVRVYPASGGVAMLPLTPANKYTPTLLFCGGTNSLDDHAWGGYGGPNANTWEHAASADCQRLTPEPLGGETAAYEQDDDMLEGRTMGQFTILPDGTMLMINGAKMGTAGYTEHTEEIAITKDLPYGMSLASDEVLTPAIYYPDRPRGQRWDRTGLAASTIPRMYHSTSLVLPDASVMVAGSNPQGDVNHTIAYTLKYDAEYRAEIWYPPYWGKQRPEPTDIPTSALTYGGNYFNITLPAGKYAGASNTAASKTKVVLLRSGFNTHAMSMGQRLLQLDNTYTVAEDGTITLHVSQLPNNPNLFTPGPALFFVVVDGVPSMGKMVSIGSGKIEKQPTATLATLPPITTSTAKGADDKDSDGNSNAPAGGKKDDASPSMPRKTIIIIAAAGGAGLIALASLLWFCCRRKSSDKAYNSFEHVAPAQHSQAAFAAPALMSRGDEAYGSLGSAPPTPQRSRYLPPAGPLAGGPPYGSQHPSAASLSRMQHQQQPYYDPYAAAQVSQGRYAAPQSAMSPSDAYGGIEKPNPEQNSHQYSNQQRR
ncbi:DUF1929-domain-containing protein [Auriculariales sp. MPI-PUGE-AT-0066]|nr:DUF1929-domain-containing protein [Auriculariales sp. MPI-PUGE-AT-0066]